MKTLHLGDCLEVLRGMPDCSVDAVVTDPPYGLSFMGKKWDYDVPSVEVWAECLRVLKPGGHLLAFAGTRTQHRMAVRIEDAGFEIRDMIAWVYGSGFPKSLDVSKAIDKAAGAERDEYPDPRWLDRYPNGNGGNHNRGEGGIYGKAESVLGRPLTTSAPATDAAQQWAGWGTALKPALEPITVARKPLAGTVAANVLEHGTGALNVDGCRVAHAEECRMMAPSQANIDNPSEKHRQAGRRESVLELKPSGRWPANLIHDGSDEVVELFPQTGPSPKQYEKTKAGWLAPGSLHIKSELQSREYGDSGSAARFFYCAKSSKKDRGEGNTHPTVKPTDLMRYLCRLVTPPGGVVLDPFMGSGSTGKAALLEGFKFVGIERDPAYFEIANARIKGDEQMSLL
jgi:DNA modification methylase